MARELMLEQAAEQRWRRPSSRIAPGLCDTRPRPRSRSTWALVVERLTDEIQSARNSLKSELKGVRRNVIRFQHMMLFRAVMLVAELSAERLVVTPAGGHGWRSAHRVRPCSWRACCRMGRRTVAGELGRVSING